MYPEYDLSFALPFGAKRVALFFQVGEFFLDLADDLVPRGDLVVAAVAHVETEDIRTGLVQGLDGVIVAGGRAQHGHDLNSAITDHATIAPLDVCYRKRTPNGVLNEFPSGRNATNEALKAMTGL